MKRPTQKTTLLIIILLIIVAVGIYAINLLNRTVDVAFEYKNIKNIEVQKILAEHDDRPDEKTMNISKSGQTKRLVKEESYLVKFTGADGYSDGEEIFTPTDNNNVVKLDPFFSSEKLASFLELEKTQIQDVIRSKYLKINLYQIESEKLHHFGEWYTANLKYIGDDLFNADTLIVILSKENNSWTIKTDPPNITISSVVYPDIPIDILKKVNNP